MSWDEEGEWVGEWGEEDEGEGLALSDFQIRELQACSGWGRLSYLLRGAIEYRRKFSGFERSELAALLKVRK